MNFILPIALILAGASYLVPERTLQVVAGIALVIAGIILLV